MSTRNSLWLWILLSPLCAFAQGVPPGAYSSSGGSGGSSGGALRVLKTNSSLDVFDRTGANLGANWTDYNNSWVPNSGSAHGTTASQWNISAYTGVSTVASQTSRITVLSLNGGTDSVGAAVRISGTPHTSDSFYVCAETTTTLQLFKVTGASDSTSGTFTALNTTKTITGAVGDTIELTIVGNTLVCNYNNWAQFIEANDASSPLTTGLPGVEQFNNVATISSEIITNPKLPAAADANIVFDGDSIVEGFGVAAPPTASVSYGATTNPYAVNLGLPGKALGVTNAISGDGSVESMLTTGTSVVDTLFASSAAKNILVIMGCTNDLAAAGRTAAQCYADLQTYVTARHTAGWKVVVSPLLSENGSDTKMQQFNELLLANSSFADAVVNLPNALIGTHAYSNATLFQADGIHPTQFAQSAIIGPALSTAIGKL